MKRVNRIVSLLLVLVMAVSLFPVMASAASSPAKLTNPNISPILHSGMTYYGKYSGTVSNSSYFDIYWDSTETSFRFAIKVLDGEPVVGNFNESGEMIVNYTDSNRFTGKMWELSKSQMSAAAGKWIKVYLGTDYWNCHYYFKVAGGSVNPDPPAAPDITVWAQSSTSIEISWDRVSGANGYKIYRSTSTSTSSFKLVKTISSGSTTSWLDTGLDPDTRYYYKVKAYNDAGDSDYSNRDYDWTDEEMIDETLSLSTENVSLTYNSGRATVTVTSNGSWAASEPDYNVSSSAVSGYDYEWLVVSSSGDKLYLTPRRPNWDDSSRSAEVTVTCGSLKKTVTVTQAKCGEAAPTLTLSRGSTALSNGSSLGTYNAQNGDMEVSVKSTNVRRISARLNRCGNNTALDTQTLTLTGAANESSMIALDMSGCTTPGDYQITIYASNSATANDYFSQSPFSGGSVMLYFTIIGGGGEPFELDIPTTIKEANAMVIYSSDNVAKSVVAGKVRHIPQVKTDSFYCIDYWRSGGYDTSGKSGSLCTRAVYSMALSYLGVDCTPGKMAELMQTTGDIDTVYYDQVTEKLPEYPELSKAKSGKLSDLFDNYANDSRYSPVYVRFGAFGDSVGHAALVIGKNPEVPNEYYCVEPSFSGTGASTVHVVTMVVNDAETKATDYTWSSCRGRTITNCYQWYLDGDSSVCSHSWGSWSNSSSTQHKRTCSKCGEAQTGNHSWGAWSNYNTTNHKHTCSVCSTVAYAAHTWNSGVVTKEPTTTSTGIRTYTCTTCGGTKTETIPVVVCSHTWGAWGTMGTNQHQRICSKCGESQTESHTWGTWISSSTSQHKHTCTKCQTTNYASHTWDSGVVTNGVMTYTCTTCGGSKTEVIPGPVECNHSWGAWGTMGTNQHERTCSKCGETQTESHTWGAWSSAGTSQHKHTCTKCQTANYADHTWNNGVVTKEPTTTSTGIRTYTCTTCGETKTETIPKLDEPDLEMPVIKVLDVNSKAGEEVLVVLTIENNTGLAGMTLKLSYPEEFTLVDISEGTALSGLDYTLPGNYSSNPISLNWDGIDADTGNGTILILKFRIAECTAEGEYPIHLSYRDGDVYDGDMEDVSLNLIDGTVTVNDTMRGDANGDNIINGKDVTLIRRYLAGGYNMSELVLQGADSNGDGVVNGKDVTMIRRYLAGGYGIVLG